jgi:uncharacterized coiled-coil protein SlyX
MTNTTRAELEPMSLVLSSLARRAWAILLVTAGVGAATWVATGMSSDPADEVTASSRVGITQAAEWPFYDVVLEQGRMIVADPSFRADLESELGFALVDLRTVIPDKLSVFDIEAVADTPDHAVAAADRAAQLVIERADAAALEQATARVASLDIEIADLDARIAELEAEIAAQTARITEIGALQATGDATIAENEEGYTVTTARDVNQMLVSDLERERASKIGERTTASATPVPEPEYQVLGLAETPDEDSSARLPITIAAALAAFLAACTAVVVIDRRIGRVRTAWQLRHVCGAPDADEVVAAGSSLRGAGVLADHLHRAAENDQRVIGVVDGTQRGVDLQLVSRQLTEHGLTTSFTNVPARVPGDDISFVDVTDEYATLDTPRRLSRQCDAVLVMVDTRTPVREASSLIERSAASPGVLTTLLVRSK